MTFDHIIEIKETELTDGTIVMREVKPLSTHQKSIFRSLAVGSSYVYNLRDLKLAEQYAAKIGLIGAY